jgi:hypothetical protein
MSASKFASVMVASGLRTLLFAKAKGRPRVFRTTAHIYDLVFEATG